MLRTLLFETWIGDRLLAALERRLGLAVVDADTLGNEPGGIPRGDHAARAAFWLAPVLTGEQNETLGAWVREGARDG